MANPVTVMMPGVVGARPHREEYRCFEVNKNTMQCTLAHPVGEFEGPPVYREPAPDWVLLLVKASIVFCVAVAVFGEFLSRYAR